MNKITRQLLMSVLLIVCLHQAVIAQQSSVPLPKEKGKHDTTRLRPVRKRFLHNVFNRIKSAVVVTRRDSANTVTELNTRSASSLDAYNGKVIRHIKLTRFTFDRVFTDTSIRFNYFGVRLMNALHTDTREWVIRDNLFFARGDSINAFLISDNERHLRSLEFIQDARIVMRPVKGGKDSVDVEVITKDLFSLTGSVDVSGTSRQRISVAETNLAGAGQKIQLTTLHDRNRSPAVGFDIQYAKTSMFHSFITGMAGISAINSDPVNADNVRSMYVQLSRPLVSPYSSVAGAFRLSFDRSANAYKKSDTEFYSYRNMNADVWIGYNLGAKKLLKDKNNRDRTFVALRYFNRHYYQVPFQIGNAYNSYFNPASAVLGEVTFFRQDFYKTNFLYGFGTTEDVPYGYNIAVTTGLYRQLTLLRPYVGVNANFYQVSDQLGLRQYFLRAGLFSNKGHLEDITWMVGGSSFSRLRYFRNNKLRQYWKFNFSRIFGRTTLDALQINNPLGLRYFSADTLRGTQRLSVYSETFMFSKYKPFGFMLAPFVFVDASMLKGEGRSFFTSDIYTGVGGGLRTRNVNLVFGTAELRFIYFPRRAQDANQFVISFSGDLKFRYNTNYIRPPDIIQMNSEDVSSFY